MARSSDSLPHPDRSEERAQLEHVCQDLQHEFPAVPPELVDLEVAQQERVFTAAPVRSFVPVLVRRRVRERLRHLD